MPTLFLVKLYGEKGFSTETKWASFCFSGRLHYPPLCPPPDPPPCGKRGFLDCLPSWDPWRQEEWKRRMHMSAPRQGSLGSRANNTPSNWDNETFPRKQTLPTFTLAICWKASLREQGHLEGIDHIPLTQKGAVCQKLTWIRGPASHARYKREGERRWEPGACQGM